MRISLILHIIAINGTDMSTDHLTLCAHFFNGAHTDYLITVNGNTVMGKATLGTDHQCQFFYFGINTDLPDQIDCRLMRFREQDS